MPFSSTAHHSVRASPSVLRGSSLSFPCLAPAAAFVFAIAVYLSVGVPASKTVAAPLESEPPSVQVEALRVLSAGNTIMIVLLGAVLALQVRLSFTPVSGPC